MDLAAAQKIAGILKNELVKETVKDAARFILDNGKKLGDNLKKYIEKDKEGKIADGEKVPEEVQAEIISTLKEILKETSEPVYMDGVALFCDGCLTEEVKEELTQILATNDLNQNTDEQYQNAVERFMSIYYGTDERVIGYDFIIEDDVIYLNFEASDTEEYFRVYEPDDIRQLVNALNHLLDDRYITRFTVY